MRIERQLSKDLPTDYPQETTIIGGLFRFNDDEGVIEVKAIDVVDFSNKAATYSWTFKIDPLELGPMIEAIAEGIDLDGGHSLISELNRHLPALSKIVAACCAYRG